MQTALISNTPSLQEKDLKASELCVNARTENMCKQESHVRVSVVHPGWTQIPVM